MTDETNVSLDCWPPENWLTYHGDQTHMVGSLLGPTITQPPERCTVVAAIYDPGHVWDDREPGQPGATGRTRLGLATGDQRRAMGAQVRATTDGKVTVLTTMVHPPDSMMR